MTTVPETKAGDLKRQVQAHYGQVALEVLQQAAPAASCCGPAPLQFEDTIPLQATSSQCCSPASDQAQEEVNAARLYGLSTLSGLPDSVTAASLGCGNPMAIAALQPGQVVLDLGSGGGIDCFLAARQVGPTGQVIGLDMTPAMVELARRNKTKLGEAAANVTFHLGEMESMPLGDESVDVIISNCVINLSPDKDAVFREAYRVLRPGGKLAISDIVALRPFPQWLAQDIAAWSGCVAGSLVVDVYLEKLRAAGFVDAVIDDLVPTGFGSGADDRRESNVDVSTLAAEGVDDWIASARIVARKP